MKKQEYTLTNYCFSRAEVDEAVLTPGHMTLRLRNKWDEIAFAGYDGLAFAQIEAGTEKGFISMAHVISVAELFQGANRDFIFPEDRRSEINLRRLQAYEKEGYHLILHHALEWKHVWLAVCRSFRYYFDKGPEGQPEGGRL